MSEERPPGPAGIGAEKPDPERPDPGRPDPGRPDPGRPDPGRPDPGRPDPGWPDPGWPDPGRPDPGETGDGATRAETSSTSTFALAGTAREAGPLVLPPGTPIGRYLILDFLGAGGMGTVHSAWDRELQRKIALKLVRPERKAGEGAFQARSRFLREAQALAQLNHPNVVAVHDLGPYGDEVFLAMEFVEGRDLRAFLDELPPPTDRRRWPRVLEVFGEIGRGLAAVHAAGLVHRDLKPANLMIGADGRARVMDFGLARRLSGDAAENPSPDGGASPLDQSLTQTGLRVGTPSYMSPEQFLGLPCDRRSDVFAFSVALYEALYGRRPFGEDAEIPQRLLAGRAEPRPAASPVPDELHRVVLRGLSREPEARWPSVEAMMAAAGAVPRRRRRRQLLAAAAAALLGLGLGAYALQRYQDRRCGEGESELAAVFGESRRQAIGKAFAAAGSFGEGTGQALLAQLDRFGRGWAAQRREACEATHRRGEQSEDLLDRRMLCLDRRLAELRAAVGLLADADLARAEDPGPALELLGDLEECADRVQLAAGGPLPPQEQRERLRRLQQRLIDARALGERPGQGEEARRLAAAAAEEAAALGYAPLRAEAELVNGFLEIEAGRGEEAYRRAMAAIAAAVAGNDDYGIARAAYQVAQVQSEALGQPREAQPWLAIAEAAAGRIGPRPLLAAGIAHSRAFVATKIGDPETALAALEESLALFRQVPGSERQQSSLYSDLGIVYSDMGRYAEASEALEKAIEMKGTGYGRDHPAIATSLNSLGSVYWLNQEYARALALHLEALEVQKKAYGTEHRLVAVTMNNVATALHGLGRLEESDAYLSEAIEIQRRVLGPDHIELANSLINLAFRFRERGDLAAALELYRQALPIVEKNLGQEHFMTAGTRHGTGVTLTRMGRHAEAVPHFEHSFAVFHKIPVDVRFRGNSSFELAKAIAGAGGDRARSRRLADQALAEFRTEAARFPKEIAAVETFLAGRR